MWSIIVWIIIGGLAGWAASAVVSKEGSRGLLGNIILGVIGGLLGGFLFEILGGSGITGLNVWSFLVAFAGAVAILLIKRVFTR